MRANNLMVGDFISVVPNNTPIQVAAIHRKKIGYHERNDKLSWVRIGLVRRIPLTREILEKNEFDCGDCYAYEEFGKKAHYFSGGMNCRSSHFKLSTHLLGWYFCQHQA